MTWSPPGRGGRGGGFALGPANNLFGTTAGDASASPTGVSPAASKSAAEGVRDTYFTANPTNLATYDADSDLNIRLFYTASGSTVIVHQIRQGSAWVDNGSVTGIQGLPGSGTDFSAISENHIPAIGPGPNKLPYDSGLVVDPDEAILTGITLQADSFRHNQAISSTSGIEEICFSNMFRGTQSHPALQRAELDQSDRVRGKDWVAPAPIVDSVRQSVDTEILTNPTFTLTVDAGGGEGITIKDFQVNFASNASDATMIVSRGSNEVFRHNFGSFSTGVQRLSLMSTPPQSTDPGFAQVLDGEDYVFQIMNASLLGNSSGVPWYTLTFRSWNYGDLAKVSDIPTTAVELTDISSAGSGSIITAAERTKLAGLASNATQGVTVQDEGVQLNVAATTLNFTGAGVTATDSSGTISVSIPGGAAGTAPITDVVSHTATGVQNYGGTVTGRFHSLASTVTAFDLLTGTTLDDNGMFAIYNGNTVAIEFDISAAAQSFGAGVADPQAYDIAGGATVLFQVDGTTIYPLADTGVGGAGGTGDHPVVLTRDTPSLTDLNTLAMESLNDNSGLWVVASNQITASESTVDSSIMIRALSAGIPDAAGVEISTTAVQKSTVLLAAGSVVRVFSSTDLRVVSAPSSTPARQLYPDIAFSGSLEVDGEGVYNTYLRRTATNAGGSNQYLRMPNLHTASRPSYVREGDVFVMRHTGTTTGNQRPHFRVNNTGDLIAGHGFHYFADPGATIAIQAPRFGLRTWQLFPVGQMADGNTYYDPEAMLPNQWYVDDAGTIAADNSVRLHHQQEIVEGIVRDHIASSLATNNPVQLRFQNLDLQDDIAWISWFSTFNTGVPPLGTTVEEIETNVPTALSWIQTNINDSYDFDLSDPDVLHSISYVTFQSVQTVKVGIDTALPDHIVLNDVITISGNSFAGNNGDWAITQIYPDRLAFDITIPSSSAANDTGASGFIARPLYARSALVSDELRVHTFNLYRNSARNSPITAFESGWFDITTEPRPDNSLLSVAYNTDVQITSSEIAVQDRSGDFYAVKGGPRGTVHYFDNTGGNYANIRYLPTNFEDIHIRTAGTCVFYMDIHPDNLPEGERRRYSIYSDLSNDDDDVTFGVGRPGVGNFTESDEGLVAFSVRNGVRQEIEMYNDGNRHGWRLVSPFSRRVPSTAITTVVTPTAGALNISIDEIVAAQNEDPNRHFVDLDSPNDRFICEGAFDFEFEYVVRLRFDGSEDTGLSFVKCELVPTLTRGGSTTDITQVSGNALDTLFFIRNGNNSDDNTKPEITLSARVRHQAQDDDRVGFELRFGTFPAGYSLSDLRMTHRQYAAQVTGGIE